MKTALKLAQMSRLAYQVPGKIRDTLQMPRLRHLSSEGAQGFVAANDKSIIIALRGTDEIQDWIDNLTFNQVNAYGGKVHTGFALQLRGIWPSLIDAVQTYHDNQKVWITGHSLGGALATLVARPLLQKYEIPSQVYTYGAPRVFDSAAAAAFQAPMKRFVNSGDIVPHLPASTLWIQCAHAGELIRLCRDGHTNLFDRIKRTLLMGSTWASIRALRDHRIGEYIRKIRLNLE